MFYLFENTRFAIEALNTNRFRTLLTLLGIIIGVASVILIGGISSSGKRIIFNELETFGLKSLWIFRSYQGVEPGKPLKWGTGINNSDIKAIAKEVRSVQCISPVISGDDVWAKYKNRYSRINLMAVNEKYTVINNDKIMKGRGFTPDDIRHRKDVCIIGQKIAEKLFVNEKEIGTEIRIGDNLYTVIGILKPKQRGFMASIGEDAAGENAKALIPFSVYQKRYNQTRADYLQAMATKVSVAKQTAEEIKNILKRRHKSQYDYASETMQQYIETAGKILRIVTWIGSMAALISLVVGGIGIMNIMVASVVERTREIGIRKSIGARRFDIMSQFLTESTLISLIGGIIGVIAGISSIWVIKIVSSKPLFIAVEYIILSLAVSLVTGVLSGIYPALRAASMDPVEALTR
ncbi:MAG: FtsX-like permease family protein [Desulfobacterales bacterium]|nr:FtsX-like permease family protein [Desulfobacterales bacterium]